MNILVLQHVTGDTGGSFLRFLPAGGASLTTVNFERGDVLPSLEPFNAMLVLGGPMDVWEVDLHPWMIAEKRAIRRFVRDMGRPYLGLCLGHQLLADALGGTCGPQKPKQVGPFSIELTEEGRADPIFAGFAPQFPAYKWHGVRVGDRAWGVQFHPELRAGTLEEWHSIPGSPESFVEHFGENGLMSAIDGARPLFADYEANAQRLVGNFIALVRA